MTSDENAEPGRTAKGGAKRRSEQPPGEQRQTKPPYFKNETIGILELRNCPEVFDAVENGRTLLVTKERKPSGILSPVGAADRGRRLRRISVTELREHTAKVIGDVKAGESLFITRKDNTIAVLSPVPEDPVERLRSSGMAIPAEDPGVVYAELPSLVARRGLFADFEKSGRTRP